MVAVKAGGLETVVGAAEHMLQVWLACTRLAKPPTPQTMQLRQQGSLI